MKPDLDTLKDEIPSFLDEQGFAVFHGHSRMLDSLPIVYWDCDRRPDYKEFLGAARSAGIRLIVFHQQEFSFEQIENAMERLETCEMPLEEYRQIERRLKDLRIYDSFTCALELSFDHEGRIYVFDLRTDWYEEFSDLLDDLQMLGAGDEDDDGDSPMTGYFSKN